MGSIILVCFLMNCIVWNIHGCSSRQRFLHVKDLIKTHKLNLFGLVEPKVGISRATEFATELKGWNFHCVPSVGLSGGIWLFWR